MASAAQNRRGIIAMLIAMTLFVGNDTLMKLAREVYPAGQAIALRAIFAISAGLALVFIFGEARKIGMALKPIVLLRGVIEATVALTFIWALAGLPLGDITAILMASPLIIVVIAVMLKIERVGWRRAAALVVGFVGVLIVIRPAPESFNASAILALISAVLVAARDLMTRKIGSDVPATVVSLTTTVIVAATSLGVGLFESWQPAWRVETAYLAVAAVLVTLGSLLIVIAFRDTDVGIVSGYRYSVVVIAVLIGYLVWGDIPAPSAAFGIALIVGSGLYTLHRARVRPDSKLKIESGPTP